MALIDIRIKGFPRGADLATVGVTAGALSGNTVVPAYAAPASITGLPRITGGQFAGQTWAVDTTGLTGITGYVWRIVGGATQGTSATLNTSGLTMGQWIECQVTSDQGVLVSPAKMVYMSHMAGHDAMDQEVLDLVPHNLITHIAVADGLWTSAATWKNGLVPRNGARVLVPRGRVVTYDNAKAYRYDWIRVDGTLNADLTKSVYCLFNEIVITRGAVFTDGIGGSRRPNTYTSEWVISSREPTQQAPGEIDLVRDPTLMGRGIISQGTRRMWGADKTPWVRTAAGSAPLIGATSAVLARAPEGWQVGDTIAIGGTGHDASRMETELRTITSFSTTNVTNDTVNWSGGLTYDHDHHHASVTRTDLQPAIGNLTRNITIRSEDPDALPFMRGHTMDMHMGCWMDIWHVAHLDLGRTIKKVLPRENGTIMGKQVADQFRYMPASGTSLLSVPMTPRSNVKSRYPVHIHMAGYRKANPDTADGCVVIGTPGWAMTHHACEAFFNNNIIYDFDGGGMCSEQGSETGEWVGNLVMGATEKSQGSLKVDENLSKQGTFGNNFRAGYSFAMTSRAIRVNSNFAMDSSIGFAFYHRNDGGSQEVITETLDMDWSTLDLKDLQGVNNIRDLTPPEYPIIHANDNEAAGMARAGFHVTKGNAQQNHLWNINVQRFKAWSFGGEGVWLEYIIQYLFTDPDVVAPSGRTTMGIHIGTNTGKVAVLRPKTERCTTGIDVEVGGANYPDSVFNATTNPKNVIAGHTSTSDGTAIVNRSSPNTLKIMTPTPSEVPVSHDLPFRLADWNGSNVGTGITSLATGVRTDTAGLHPLPFYNEPSGMPVASNDYAQTAFLYAQEHGYWNISGVNHVIFPLYFADMVYGTPIKTWHGLRCVGTLVGPNRGTYTLSANAPVVSPATMAVTENGGVHTLDILALASDPDGGTLTVSDSYEAPNHGRFSLAAGVVSYTPDRDYEGTDKARVWVEDNAGHSTRVDIAITVS